MKWFKVYSEMFRDYKFGNLSSDLLSGWLRLCCAASSPPRYSSCKSGDYPGDGCTGYSKNNVYHLFNNICNTRKPSKRHKDKIDKIINGLLLEELIKIGDDGFIYVSEWEESQGAYQKKDVCVGDKENKEKCEYRAIKEKPTTYKGVKFRSRLEARWAVFFDYCGVKWEYEPQTFYSDEGRYTPDFMITTFDGVSFFVEVKPGKYYTEALAQARKILSAYKCNGVKSKTVLLILPEFSYKGIETASTLVAIDELGEACVILSYLDMNEPGFVIPEINGQIPDIGEYTVSAYSYAYNYSFEQDLKDMSEKLAAAWDGYENDPMTVELRREFNRG